MCRARAHIVRHRAGASAMVQPWQALQTKKAVAAERDVLPRQTLLLSWRKSLGENPPNRAPMTKGARGSGSMPAMPARSTRLTRPRSGFKRKDARHDDGTDSNASLTSLQRSQCPNIVRTACAGGAQCCVATDFSGVHKSAGHMRNIVRASTMHRKSVAISEFSEIRKHLFRRSARRDHVGGRCPPWENLMAA